MLAFLPWLKLRESVREGPFHLFQFQVDEALPADVASTTSLATLSKLLGQYRASANVPLRSITVLQFNERPIGADFNDVERAAIFQFARHLAVSGLSDRRFIGGYLNDYTAAGHYQVVIQAFTEPFSGSVSLSHRRKDGQSNVFLGQSDVHFVRPAHLVRQGEPNLNLQLLTGLQAGQKLPSKIREHVDASVTQFLLANSDSPDVPLDAESIATYAALERVTNSSQRLDDIQAKLPFILSLVDSSPWTEHLCRELDLHPEDGRPVLRSWLKHIYRLRGNVAHGKPANWQPNAWTQQEHLVAGSFVYPLALKCLLAKHELYSLTLEDVAWTLGLEGLLRDRPFFNAASEDAEADDLHDEAVPNELAVSDSLGRRMPGWLRQFDNINSALLGIELSGTIRDVIERLGAQVPDNAKPK